jgi:hypothetical protein
MPWPKLLAAALSRIGRHGTLVVASSLVIAALLKPCYC